MPCSRRCIYMTTMNEDELKSGKQIWDSIESILEDLDKDQIDRLMALGSDDPELFIDEILKVSVRIVGHTEF